MLRLPEPSIEIKIGQISVRDLIEWLCQQVGQIGQAQWDLAGHGYWIPNPRHDGPPRSNQNDSLVWGVLQHHLFAQYGRQATCCWTSWQIGLVEAGATCCILLGRPPEGETTLFGWFGLAWIACLRPHSASLCRAFGVTWFLAHQVKIFHSKAQSGPNLMPPSVLMYDTTVVLSVSTSTILCIQRSWNSFKARKTALSSR